MSRKILTDHYRSPKLAHSHELHNDELLVAVHTKSRKGVFYVDTLDIQTNDRITDKAETYNLKKLEIWCRKTLIPSAGHKVYLIDQDLQNI